MESPVSGQFLTSWMDLRLHSREDNKEKQLILLNDYGCTAIFAVSIFMELVNNMGIDARG